MEKKINLLESYERFTDRWSPKVVGEMNGQYVKLAKVSGTFVWHDHAAEDELFLIQRGRLHLEFRDGRTVTLNPGELYIVPRGVEHRPYTDEGEEAWLVLIEPKATKHTGEVVADVTQTRVEWLR